MQDIVEFRPKMTKILDSMRGVSSPSPASPIPRVAGSRRAALLGDSTPEARREVSARGRRDEARDDDLPRVGHREFCATRPCWSHRIPYAPGRSNYLYGNVAGEVSPFVEARAGWESDGLQVKLRLDLGLAVTDYRFGVTGVGA